MIAALPMYDLPELRAETDLFWQGLRRHLAAAGLANVPDKLTRNDDLYAHWLDPQVLLTQTCGFPLTHALKGKVHYVATPGYSAPGCDGTAYRSFIIVRDDSSFQRGGELGGRVAAYNGEDSQSGWNILKLYLANQGIANGQLRAAIESGGHRESAALVKAGVADFCAVDCVTWALIASVAPGELLGLRILDQTPMAPCLPFITSHGMPVEDIALLRMGLRAAFSDPELAEIRAMLMLEMVTELDEEAYSLILEQEKSAQLSGWARVA